MLVGSLMNILHDSCIHRIGLMFDVAVFVILGDMFNKVNLLHMRRIQ